MNEVFADVLAAIIKTVDVAPLGKMLHPLHILLSDPGLILLLCFNCARPLLVQSFVILNSNISADDVPYVSFFLFHSNKDSFFIEHASVHTYALS
jgi:hypothetical protein